MQMGYASDRFNINSQLKHLQAKYVGTVNIQRDSYAYYVGYYPVMSYFAITENESIGIKLYNFMQVFTKLVYNTCGLVNELSYFSC
ncbi:hypothetical protein MKX01_017066 [Papaver californicum]|nr:hypothetical protein MKX01_017066 [Papaver californicum]